MVTKRRALTRTQKKDIDKAEEMLRIFEGITSSCRDRGALPGDVHAHVVKLSRSIRARLRKYL